MGMIVNCDGDDKNRSHVFFVRANFTVRELVNMLVTAAQDEDVRLDDLTIALHNEYHAVKASRGEDAWTRFCEEYVEKPKKKREPRCKKVRQKTGIKNHRGRR
jgi:adenosine deaminase